jgi:protein-tyrosine phosphatase/membrane-associated phospholipid phosphatase
VFAWEQHIPFLDWTIIPYWSINVFYALSLFICATHAELNAHVRRLLTAQFVAVSCFLLVPLRFTFQQPATEGIPGVLFAALASFDKPFNQAPSLHIALLVILWPLYATHLPRVAQWALHIWFSLVAASVLTTYQHHFFDMPTGVLLGAFSLWLWPESGPGPFAAPAPGADRRRLIVAGWYLIGSGSCAVVGLLAGGAALWLLWPSVSLALVAANYAFLGAAGFQKDAGGRMSVGARLLLAPYLVGAFVNSRLWTRRDARPVAIADGVWLGRLPARREAARFATVVDLCAELPGAAASEQWRCVPMLDLVVPGPSQLRAAAVSIEHRRDSGPLLVCCALGYSRSAAAVATWLVTTNVSTSLSEALERIRQARPRIVIDGSLREAITTATSQSMALPGI